MFNKLLAGMNATGGPFQIHETVSMNFNLAETLEILGLHYCELRATYRQEIVTFGCPPNFKVPII